MAKMEEYYKLDAEDFIDDMPCRFKYKEVSAASYPLLDHLVYHITSWITSCIIGSTSTSCIQIGAELRSANHCYMTALITSCILSPRGSPHVSHHLMKAAIHIITPTITPIFTTDCDEVSFSRNMSDLRGSGRYRYTSTLRANCLHATGPQEIWLLYRALLAICRFRYIAWVTCPYRVAGKASALGAGSDIPKPAY
jgi:hypothetical protein